MLDGIKNSTARVPFNTLAFALGLAIAALTLFISELGAREAGTELNRLVTMGEVRLELARLVRRVTDAESGQRGCMLTNRSEYLGPYRNASRDVQNGILRLHGLYRDLGDRDSEARLALMEADVRTKLSELDEVIAMQDDGRKSSALELVLSGIGRDEMDSLRGHGDALLALENRRVEAGLRSVFDTLRLHRVGVAVMTAISLLMLGLFLRQRQQLDRQRAKQQARVGAERDRLEAEVRLRTVELTQLARHLESAREDERARLARDLHDELGALLTAAKLEVARIRPKLLQSAPELTPRLGNMIELLNSGIALKRRIIEDLRPSTLDTLGLVAALEVLCSEFATRLGVPVNTRLEAVALTPSAELTAYRLVQESLTNIAKHAHAAEVQVTLEGVGDGVRVQVHDDGVGFEPQTSGLAKHGLIGMRYRVEAEEGQFELRSAAGQGTTVSARLPNRQVADQGAMPASPAFAAPAD